jgi:hypothetical protein
MYKPMDMLQCSGLSGSGIVILAIYRVGHRDPCYISSEREGTEVRQAHHCTLLLDIQLIDEGFLAVTLFQFHPQLILCTVRHGMR